MKVLCVYSVVHSIEPQSFKFKKHLNLNPIYPEFKEKWNKAAFVLNLPDEYYFRSPCNFFKSLSKSEIFLIEILVPSHKYHEVFDRINYLIDNSN